MIHSKTQKLPISDFDYELPSECIAQEPLADRASSRLMVLDRANGDVQHRVFRDLPGLLQPGDLLVVNDSRVLPARLRGYRSTGPGAAPAIVGRKESVSIAVDRHL